MMLQIEMIIRIVMLKVFEAMAKKGLEMLKEEEKKKTEGQSGGCCTVS